MKKEESEKRKKRKREIDKAIDELMKGRPTE